MLLLIFASCMGANTAKSDEKDENPPQEEVRCALTADDISMAKEMWVLVRMKKPGDEVIMDEAVTYWKQRLGNATRSCSTNGEYSWGKVGENPKCSIHGDILARAPSEWVRNASEEVEAKTRNPLVSCADFLREIALAKEMLALATKKGRGDEADDEGVITYLRGGKASMSACPEGGRYFIGAIGQPSTCSKHTPPEVLAQLLLRKKEPELANTITVSGANPSSTMLCFRTKEGGTYVFRTKTGKSERIVHAKRIHQGQIKKVTYEDDFFILWDGKNKVLSVGAGE
jgi:hypothetical protein